ncbi:type II secretion system protein [Janthinobacterium sp. EB271-G4-7A]|uniref:type II secretion system protein n=1 Tax=Janthinobacterium sp. EB271-G4-7A TaxID=2775056 RepID=UPI001E4DD938|nr:type II secretion system protein [Janthinobacterium sp. EB271-G4-7A]MCC7698887.1 type II secretion system protein [Janthinobacterium sp. EB271-G4-7A]
MHRPARRQRGFTYLGLIILVAILGLVGAAGLKMGSLLQRQATEQELLDIGAQFSDALYSYAAATPAGQPQQPPTLAALLRDPRFPQLRRHLRKLYVDPITGRAEWGLLYQPGSQGIIGVHSLSQAVPLKVGNFEARFAGFEGKAHFSEWRFMVDARLSSVPPAGPTTVPASDEAGIMPALPAPPLFSRPVTPSQEQAPPEPVEPPEPQSPVENPAE